MKKIRSHFALALFAGLLASCATSPGPAGTAATTPKSEVASDQPFPVLTKGMTAEKVRQKLGEPAEIKPMASPAGKAEVWVYHFEKDIGMEQVAAGMRDVPSFGMASQGSTNITQSEPIYTTVAKKAKVTLSLLMFNGQLTAQKAAVENTNDYSS